MVESVSTYFRRCADKERRLAGMALDADLRRIHLARAEAMDGRARDLTQDDGSQSRSRRSIFGFRRA